MYLFLLSRSLFFFFLLSFTIANFRAYREVFMLAAALTPKPKDFVIPERRFKRETEVNEWEGGTLKPRTLIYLTDSVLSVKKKNADTIHLKSMVMLKV